MKIRGGMRPYTGRCAECKRGVRREGERAVSAVWNAYGKRMERVWRLNVSGIRDFGRVHPRVIAHGGRAGKGGRWCGPRRSARMPGIRRPCSPRCHPIRRRAAPLQEETIHGPSRPRPRCRRRGDRRRLRHRPRRRRALRRGRPQGLHRRPRAGAAGGGDRQDRGGGAGRGRGGDGGGDRRGPPRAGRGAGGGGGRALGRRGRADEQRRDRPGLGGLRPGRCLGADAEREPLGGDPRRPGLRPRDDRPRAARPRDQHRLQAGDHHARRATPPTTCPRRG